MLLLFCAGRGWGCAVVFCRVRPIRCRFLCVLLIVARACLLVCLLACLPHGALLMVECGANPDPCAIFVLCVGDEVSTAPPPPPPSILCSTDVCDGYRKG